MFDFKRRDDDLEDDNEDEESEFAGTEFDDIMRRVKRAKDDSGDSGDAGDNSEDKTVRMYHRAGFGESYPDDGKSAEMYQRRRRGGVNADEAGMGNFDGNYVSNGLAYRNVVRQIREASVDKNNEDDSYRDTKRRNINDNEYRQSRDNDEVSRNGMSRVNEENPEKISEGRTKERRSRITSVKEEKDEVRSTEKAAADAENREVKSDKDKRSAASKAKIEGRKQRLSANEIPGDNSAASSKVKLDESLKTAPMEPPAEAAAHRKLDGPLVQKEANGKEYRDEKPVSEISHAKENKRENVYDDKRGAEQKSTKKEVDKSEPMDDDVHKKIANEHADEKKEEDQDQKNVWRQPDNEEKLEHPSDHDVKKSDKRSSRSENDLPAPHAAKPEELATKSKPDDNASRLIFRSLNVKERVEKLESPKITEDSHTKEESNEEDKVKMREISNIQDQRESKLVSSHEEIPPQDNSELKAHGVRGESEAKLKQDDHEQLKEQEVNSEKVVKSRRDDNAKSRDHDDQASSVEENHAVDSKPDNEASAAKMGDESKNADASSRDDEEKFRPPGWYLDLKQSLQEGRKEPPWYRGLTQNEAVKDPNGNERREEDKKYAKEKYSDEGITSNHEGSSYREDKKGNGDAMSDPRYDESYRRDDETRDRNSYDDGRQSFERDNDKSVANEAYSDEGREKSALRAEDKSIDDARRLKYEDNDNYEDDKRLMKYSDKENQKYHSSSSSSEHEAGAINSEINEADDHRNARWMEENSGFEETDQAANERIRRDLRSDEIKRKLLWMHEADDGAAKDGAKGSENGNGNKDSSGEPKEDAKIQEKLVKVIENAKDDEKIINIVGEGNEKLKDGEGRSEKGDSKQTSSEHAVEKSVKDYSEKKENESANEKSKSVKRSVRNAKVSNDKVRARKRRRKMIQRGVTGNLKNPPVERRSVKKDAYSESKKSQDVRVSDSASNVKSVKLQKRLSDKYDNNGETAKNSLAFERENVEDNAVRGDTSVDLIGKRSLVYEKEPRNAEEEYEEADDERKDVYQDAEDSEEEPEDSGDELSTGDNESIGSISSQEGRDPLKDKVNMLIRQRIDCKSKSKQGHLRRRRGPVAAVYYDYDADVGRNNYQDSQIVDQNKQTSLSAVEGI